MAQPNLSDATLEFIFTPQEVVIAKQLDPLHIMWYQTKYAQLWKYRNSITVPSEAKDYEGYFRHLAEIDGKLGQIQELFDDHNAGTSELKEAALMAEEQRNQEQKDVASRASNLVNKSSS